MRSSTPPGRPPTVTGAPGQQAPKALLGLLLLAIAGPAWGQSPSEVVGRVLDGSGAPIQGASVLVVDAYGSPLSGAPALTGVDGSFRLPLAGPAGSSLRVEAPGVGTHDLPLQAGGTGTLSGLEITITPDGARIVAARLDPVAVRSSSTSRNLIGADRLQEGAAAGMSLGQFLAREVPGLRVLPNTGVGGGLCVEFRMSRGDDTCRPPQVFLDGSPILSPLHLFQSMSPGELEQVQMVPPSEAGSRFGGQGGWGVLLLRTTSAVGFDATGDPTLLGSGGDLRPRVDWSAAGEAHPYRWGRVYTAAFVGNAVGLVGGMALMRQCMDLGERRIYRNEDHCGHVNLALAAISLAFLPSLGGGAGAHVAGATPMSTGRMLYSTMAAQALLVPGFALITQTNGSSGERSTAEVVGLVLITAGAPLVNAVVDRFFRDPR